MTRDNRVQVYVSDAELARLNDMADQADKSVSHLCRDAILEYTDRDRTERIESEVRDMHDKMDRVLALVDGQHTHTRGSKNQSVPETARAIAQAIYDRHEAPIRDDDVEIAIEDLGGADDRTVEKYRQQLKKRGLLYEHPVSSVWTDDRREWVEWQQKANIGREVYEIVNPYGMSVEEYDELAAEIEVPA